MRPQPKPQETSPWLVLLIAVGVGALAVLVSVYAFGLMLPPGATRDAKLQRVTSFMYWSQPFIYLMAGLIAGAGGDRWGAARGPVVGMLLGGLCWVLLRREELLPDESSIATFLLVAGAIAALVGAVIAPVLKGSVGTVVLAMVGVGILGLLWIFLNLGSVSGVVQREQIVRVAGQAQKWETVPVPEARVALLDAQASTVLYETKTNSGGRYQIGRAPLGEYTLRVWDPVTPEIISEKVTLERSITGGTRWKQIALPTITQDSGPLFE